MKLRGFTIVELIIVITISGILLTLGVINLRDSQANGRDAERKMDIETIAQHLETFYTSGSDDTTTTGSYPSTLLTTSVTTASVTNYLRDIDVKSITAPGKDDPALTFKPATNALQTTIDVLPQPTIDQYVYQPLQTTDGGTTWSLCTTAIQECRKFNLFYKLEVANISADCPSPGFVCKLTSINQ